MPLWYQFGVLSAAFKPSVVHRPDTRGRRPADSEKGGLGMKRVLSRIAQLMTLPGLYLARLLSMAINRY